MSLLDHQTILAGRWARRYAEMGFNPLPSYPEWNVRRRERDGQVRERPDAKRPALGAYKRWLQELIPREWLENWHWRNIQLVCGVRWGLCCIDIDGLAGLHAWREMAVIGREGSRIVPTWCCESPDVSVWFCGRKLFFRLPMPNDFGLSVPTVVLWAGSKHEEVKFIGDGGLAVVPPSIHPERKTFCEWLRGPSLDSEEYEELPMIPEWLLLKVLNHKARPAPKGITLEPLRRPRHPAAQYRSDEVLAALGDSKIEIAVHYGLRIVKCGPSFAKCHAVDRPDENPSCTMDRRTGRYFDWTTNDSCSFFDLLVKLDPQTFPTWQDARAIMGAHIFGGR